jgi:nitrite reductase/ring-hydroxylating ferredoxin subunit
MSDDLRPRPAGTEPAGRAPTRRSVLGLAVSVGAVGVVAACGGGGDTAEPAASTSQPAGEGSVPETSAGPSGEVLVAAADVPVGSGLVLTDVDVVVTQPAAGEFKAFSSVCTHERCPMSGVSDRIECTCHGSRFDLRDGSPLRGPATRPLSEIPVRVEGDSVVRA